MLDEVKKSTEQKMEKSIETLFRELKKIRTGRAQASMLDNIKLTYYGNITPLNQAASISCPDAKTFLIAPWEVNILKDIEAAIVQSNLGMNPQNDGKVIRLKLPDLTEERRKDFVKQIKKIVEEARVAVRMVRRDANESVKKYHKDKIINEDEQKKSQADIQKITDSSIKKIDTIGESKEKELLTI